MNSSNWTQIAVEMIRAIAKLLVAKMRKGHRDSDGGPGTAGT
jgi:hypothetical protein